MHHFFEVDTARAPPEDKHPVISLSAKKRSLRVFAARTALVPCLARLATIPASLGAAPAGLLFVRTAPAAAPTRAVRRGHPAGSGEAALHAASRDLRRKRQGRYTQ